MKGFLFMYPIMLVVTFCSSTAAVEVAVALKAGAPMSSWISPQVCVTTAAKLILLSHPNMLLSSRIFQYLLDCCGPDFNVSRRFVIR